MKCCCCNSKKGKRICSRYNNHLICNSCCGNIRNIKQCNSMCEFMHEENNELFPLSSIELTEQGRGKVTLFSENLFLPNFNECLLMDVKSISINIKSPILISVSLKFKLCSRVNRIINMDELYFNDDWKRNENKILPFLQVYTIGSGKIYNETIKHDGAYDKIIVENNHLDTWLPNSKSVFERISKNEIQLNSLPVNTKMSFVCYGKHFVGKNSTLLSNLKLNIDYELNFDVEYDSVQFSEKEILLPLGLFFPFELVMYDKYNVNIVKGCHFTKKTELQLLLPFENKEYNIFAIPLENNNIISSPYYCKHALKQINNKFYYNQYAILNHMFYISLDSIATANVIFSKIPIFTGIYDTFNKVYNDEYSPIQIFIFNNSSDIEKYKVEVEIFDLSHKYAKQISVEPYQIRKLNISPILIDNKILQMTSNVEKEIYVKISHEDNLIYETSGKCLVYPRENFVETLDNKRKDWKIDFKSFLARWVTPNDKVIDNIISQASLNNGILGGTTNNYYRIQEDMKKIYDVLAEMNYSVRTLTFSEGNYHVQRISLPKNTVRLKSGNCIDLTVLLASCYEAIKLKVYIVLIPNHAFLKVKINDNYSEYIESTCLGKNEFNIATEMGRKKYDEYFDYLGNSKKDNCYIVDIENARKSMILPMN